MQASSLTAYRDDRKLELTSNIGEVQVRVKPGKVPYLNMHDLPTRNRINPHEDLRLTGLDCKYMYMYMYLSPHCDIVEWEWLEMKARILTLSP